MGVVRHVDAEVVLHPRVPRLGQVVERQSARDELLLELEAQDDVQVVGHLVGLDADERRLAP